MLSARHPLCAALAALCVLLSSAAVASAAPVSLVVDTLTPEMEEGSKGTSKLSLTFTNISDEAFVLTPKAVGQPKCKLTLSDNQLPSGVITPVEVEIPSDCDRGEKLKVVIDSASTAGPGKTITLDPEEAPDEDPDWSQLLAFPIALVVSLVLTLLISLFWWTPGANASRNLKQPLRYLDATWKFNDNWVTNVSAVGAILTGLFSASTAKAFLGDDAEAQVALGTVGAAVALAFVATAPVVLLALKSLKVEKDEQDDTTRRANFFTVGGLACASALVLASAAGQLWVILQVALSTEIGTLTDAFAIAAVVLAGLLLLVYSVRSLRDLLQRGTEKPKEAKEVEIRAADVIAEAITANRRVAEGVPAEEVDLEMRGAGEASLYESPEPPRSALI